MEAIHAKMWAADVPAKIQCGWGLKCKWKRDIRSIKHHNMADYMEINRIGLLHSAVHVPRSVCPFDQKCTLFALQTAPYGEPRSSCLCSFFSFFPLFKFYETWLQATLWMRPQVFAYLMCHHVANHELSYKLSVMFEASLQTEVLHTNDFCKTFVHSTSRSLTCALCK